MRSTIDALVEAESRSELVQRSILPFKLPELEPCADGEALEEQPRPSEHAVDPERVADVHRMIDRAHTLRDGGASGRGITLAKQARAEAAALGDSLLLLEALECLGRLQAESSAQREAIATLSEAVVLAASISADELAAKSWLWLLYAMTMEHELSSAKARMLAVEAAVERTGDDRLRAWWLNNVGILYAETDQVPQAEDYLRRAHELRLRTFGEGHVEVGISWHNLANLLSLAEDLRGAEEAFAHAQEIFDATVGSLHPLTISVETGRCSIDLELRRYSSAIERCGRVLASMESSPLPPLTEHRVRQYLAKALWSAGREAEALEMAQRARRLEESVGPAESEALRKWIAEHDPQSLSGTPNDLP